MKNLCQFLFIAFLAVCLFTPAQAAAHRLNVFAWLDNDQILVECNFGDKHPAVNAQVNVTDDATKQSLLHGTTNGNGNFAFPVPEVIRQGHGLLITVNAGQGHVGQWTMDASELYAAASLTAGFDAAAIENRQQQHENIRLREATTQVAPEMMPQPAAGGNVGLPTTQMSQEDMRAIIHGALEQHLSPIHRQLAAQSAKGPTIAEIIGGIGWIIGLVGIALYFKSRKA